ncbi:hypothetical protein PGT21_034383 [Puccinia graminis f. sp. tritici]|uniref:Uncharacterized protein n=1 Tax=Puccinia graminis f. sp. tritici TaxID=56615 RepID=A0A5B0MFB8_PUCGR|nr:hypothetical protein PGT21_034383 [Puccinia graminis f. sp. tritici]
MTQEPSILPDLSNRATQEYSDLFAVSGSSFLTPIDQITINNSNTTIETSSPPLSNRYDTSSLIDLKTPKRTSPTTDQPKTTRSSPAKKYSDLMDHSISSYDLLPKALCPSTPSSRKNIHLLFSPKVPPRLSWTPPTSPKNTNKILSSELTRDEPSNPSIPARPKSAQASSSSNITRTHSVDLLGLYEQNHHHTPRPPITRSKSTTAIHHWEETDQTELSSIPSDEIQQQHQPKTTKSILKRPNSPSKGTRARFFSPRALSGPTGDDESDGNEVSWVDEHGNCRGREIIHEFQKDEPPMTRPKPILQSPQSPSPQKNTLPPPPSSSSSSTARRHHHTPKFIIPEPIDLGIEPILPRHSTSPSPSPPSLPPSSYLMNARAHRKSASTNTCHQVSRDPLQRTRSVSNSLIFNTPDNLSNILDESGGFLVGNETTWNGGDNNKERSTELSIDLNHVAMMELLGKKNLAKLRPGSVFAKLNATRGSECLMVPEEEESVDVSGLARQLEDKKSCPSDNLALTDEQAPPNLRGSMDFSTTFESSKINLPPLPTDREELWKNSQPKEQKKPPTTTRLAGVTRAKRYSMSSVDPQILGQRGGILDEETARLKKKIDSIKLSSQEDTRSVTKDDLFSELMSAPPPALGHQREKASSNRPISGQAKPTKPPPPPPSSERRPTAAKRLSAPVVVAFPGGKPQESKITSTNPVSKPRMSCISTSVVPVRAKRSSNIGIGLPASSSAPAVNALASKLSRPSTTGLTGVRSKLKPSNALVKPGLASGSPKTMKSRSSLSTITLNSPRPTYNPSPKKPSLLAQAPPIANTKMSSPTKIRKTLPVPDTTSTIPAPRPYTSTGSSARSSLLEPPSSRSALPQPASLGHRPRTSPFASNTLVSGISRPSSSSSRIIPPASEPSKTLTARHIKQTL